MFENIDGESNGSFRECSNIIMEEEKIVEIARTYGLGIAHAGINRKEAYHYVFDLSPAQMHRLQLCDLHNFNYRAKMFIVEKFHVPIGQILGTYEVNENSLKLTGSIEYIFMMLKQIFD